MSRFSSIENRCFAGMANSHPSAIKQKIYEGYYGIKPHKGRQIQHALNPFTGNSVIYHSYNRMSDDNLCVKDVCRKSEKLGIYIRIDLTQIPNIPLDMEKLNILIGWIEDCIEKGKKIQIPSQLTDSNLKTYQKVVSVDEYTGQETISIESEYESETDSEMDDFIVKDEDYSSEEDDYSSEEEDYSSEEDDYIEENPKRKRLKYSDL